jgi:hypothetical protein
MELEAKMCVFGGFWSFGRQIRWCNLFGTDTTVSNTVSMKEGEREKKERDIEIEK